MSYMTQKTFTTVPNFLASEHMIQKTRQVTKDMSNMTENNKEFVKGGTVYPSNDTNAEGIVFETVDVTNGDVAASVIVSGRIYKNRLHTVPIEEAMAAMKDITFVDAPETERGY